MSTSSVSRETITAASAAVVAAATAQVPETYRALQHPAVKRAVQAYLQAGIIGHHWCLIPTMGSAGRSGIRLHITRGARFAVSVIPAMLPGWFGLSISIPTPGGASW